MCPGMHLVERNMWRIAAKLLWVFDISESTDVMGNTMPLDPNGSTSAILVSPLPFKVKVAPRSEKHLASIKREIGWSARVFVAMGIKLL